MLRAERARADPGVEVALTGYACRLPGAPDAQAFWRLLQAGETAIGQISPDRWSNARYVHGDAASAGFAYSGHAGLLEDLWAFDAAFFGLSAREAAQMDPQQRLLLEVAWEAFEAAGLAADPGDPARVGVFIGASSTDHAVRFFADPAAIDSHFMTGNTLSILANRIAYLFDLKGPSYTIDTACSSSFFALHNAVEALKAGQIDTAIVGGVNAILSPFNYVGFSRAAMLSPKGRCQAFGAGADGYVRAEGAVAVVLRRADLARQANEPLRGLIAASGVNTDGRKAGLSMPSEAGQADLLHQVYCKAGLSPDDLAFVEAHGTGTAVGDPVEAGALGTVLGQGRRRGPLPIGSVKSNIGHLEAGSGLVGLLKAQLALEHGVYPATLHAETLNPGIDFAGLGLSVARAPVPIAPRADGKPWLAGVSSFGFGGANAHVVLAETPAAPDVAIAPDLSVPLVLSARSEASLRALAGAWRDRLAGAEAGEISALARTAAHRCAWHDHRLVVAGAGGCGAAALSDTLGAVAEGRDPEGVEIGRHPAGPQPGKTAFLYSGNGAQWQGMGRALYAGDPDFRAHVDRVGRAFAETSGHDPARDMAPDAVPDLTDAEIAQPLLFTLQAALTLGLSEHGLRPDAVAGHSVGEVAAAWASGTLGLADAARVITVRARAVRPLRGTGGMAAVLAGADGVVALLETLDLPGLAIAAENSPRSTTVTGPSDQIEAFLAAARRAGLAARRLKIAYPYHGAALDAVEDEMQAGLAGLAPAPPAQALVSTVTGEKLAALPPGGAHWWRNARLPVAFQPAVERLIAFGCRCFVEIGPRPVLAGYVTDTLQAQGVAGAVLDTLSERAEAPTTLAGLAARLVARGVTPDKTGFAGLRGPAARALPAYPWDRKPYRHAATPEAMDIFGPGAEHPLLGHRLRPGEGPWRAVLDLETLPWLADHRVEGAVTLPFSAFVEIALAAGQAALGAGPLELSAFAVTIPLIFEVGERHLLRTRLEPETGCLSIESRPHGAEAGWQLHARGTLRRGLESPRARPRNAPLPVVSLTPEALYRQLGAVGLDYGPAFRRLCQLRHGAGRARVKLNCSDEAEGRYLCDPARLDACFHGLAPLAAEADALLLPVRVERLFWWGGTGAPAMAAIEATGRSPQGLEADLAIFDAGETLALQIDGLRLQRVVRRNQDKTGQIFWRERMVLLESSADSPGPDLAGLEAEGLLRPARESAEPGAAALLRDALLRRGAFDALAGLAAAQGGGAIDPAGLAPTARPVFDHLIALLQQDDLLRETSAGLRLATECPYPTQEALVAALMAEDPEGAAALTGLLAFCRSLERCLEGVEAAPELPPPGVDCPARKARWAVLEAGVANQTCQPGALLVLGDVSRAAATTFAGLGIPLIFSDPNADRLTALADVLPANCKALIRPWPEVGPAHGFAQIVAGGRLSAWPSEVFAQLHAFLRPGGRLLAVESPLALSLDPLHAVPDMLTGAGFDVVETRALTGGAAMELISAIRRAEESSAPRPERRIAVISGLAGMTEPPASVCAACAEAGVMLDLAGSGEEVLIWLSPSTVEDADISAAIATLWQALKPSLTGSAADRTLWLISAPEAEGTDARLFTAALRGLCRVAANEHPEITTRLVELAPGWATSDQVARLAGALRAPPVDRAVTLTAEGVCAARLEPASVPLVTPPARAEEGEEVGWQLCEAESGGIAALKWRPVVRPAPGPGEVELEPAATGLNFRDVMWAQRLLPAEALEAGLAGAALGMECAGRVSRAGPGVEFQPGDRVMGFAPRAFASHVILEADHALEVPEDMPLEIAAGLPVAFFTAQYALVELARLAPGERVLIHGAAGGVGLAALQIAQGLGARVYATAGQPGKRALLRRLGVEAVFSSRDLEFAEALRTETGGAGVDVGLNALSGEAMARSVECLAPFGRFVELGKQDLYQDSRLALRPFRRNLSFFAVDADQLVMTRPDLTRQILAALGEGFATGRLSAPPVQLFEAGDVVAGFRRMHRADHSGKIVIRPPRGRLPAPRPAEVGRGAWLVTGGLGGLGLATARWLADQGVREMWLISRSGRPPPGEAGALFALRATGAEIHTRAADVTDRGEMTALIAEIAGAGIPLEGVVHAAMQLEDGPLVQLSDAALRRVLAPKLDGARLLDRLTRDLAPDHFVLFSSVAARFGNPGQGAYVAANLGLEALAEARRAAGLPALAIAWGPIADCGHLARKTVLRQTLERQLGGQLLTAEQALSALGDLLAQSELPTCVTVAPMEWGYLAGRLALVDTPLFEAVERRSRSADQGGEDLLATLRGAPEEKALPMLLARFQTEAGRILHHAATEIETARPLADLGFDSLMAVDLKLSMEEALGVNLPVMGLSDQTSLAELAARSLARIRAGAASEEDDLIAGLAARHLPSTPPLEVTPNPAPVAREAAG